MEISSGREIEQTPLVVGKELDVNLSTLFNLFDFNNQREMKKRKS